MDIGKIELPCNAKLVNGVTTVWSNSFRLGNSRVFGCQVQCLGSNPQIQIQLEESYYDLGLNNIAQGVSDPHWVVPDAYPDIFSLISDNNWHLPAESITPVPMIHGRFKINGLPGNGSNVTVTIYLFRQEAGRFL
jgi:hypothetical protein